MACGIEGIEGSAPEAALGGHTLQPVDSCHLGQNMGADNDSRLEASGPRHVLLYSIQMRLGWGGRHGGLGQQGLMAPGPLTTLTCTSRHVARQGVRKNGIGVGACQPSQPSQRRPGSAIKQSASISLGCQVVRGIKGQSHCSDCTLKRRRDGTRQPGRGRRKNGLQASRKTG